MLCPSRAVGDSEQRPAASWRSFGRHRHGEILEIRRNRRFVKTHNGQRYLEIKNTYYKGVNRRFYSRFFGPDAVSSKEDPERELLVPAQEETARVDENGHRWIERGSRAMYAQTSPRGRLFSTHATGLDIERDDWGGWRDDWAGDLRPLLGYDCCGSMVQILCMVLGWRDEEREVARSPFKEGLVAGMRATGHAGGFVLPAGASDLQLRKAAGQLQNIAYGASLVEMARTLNGDPDMYGAPWGSWRNLEDLLQHGSDLDYNVRLLKRLKDEYLPVCREAADAALARDPFRDMFDGAPVRWHPPARQRQEIPHGATPLFVNRPGIIVKGKFVPTTPNERGEYPVDPGTLRRRIAPGLIHSLDSAFAGHVILILHDEYGVRDIVPIYDCFLVASDAERALYDAVVAAGEPWFRSLGSFYDAFEDYLPGHPVVRRWREVWERRVAAGNDWPTFLMKREITYHLTRA